MVDLLKEELRKGKVETVAVAPGDICLGYNVFCW